MQSHFNLYKGFTCFKRDLRSYHLQFPVTELTQAPTRCRMFYRIIFSWELWEDADIVCKHLSHVNSWPTYQVNDYISKLAVLLDFLFMPKGLYKYNHKPKR